MIYALMTIGAGVFLFTWGLLRAAATYSPNEDLRRIFNEEWENEHEK